ncbi:MAG: hypothetical protein R3B93_12855 [Bacteroidia bacterium]
MLLKQYIRKLKQNIAEANTEIVINELTDLLSRVDDNLYDDIILIAGKYNNFQRNYRKGIIHTNNNELEIIHNALLEVIKEVEKSETCHQFIEGDLEKVKQTLNNFGINNPEIRQGIINIDEIKEEWLARNEAGNWLEDQSPQLEQKVIKSVRESSILIDNIFSQTDNYLEQYYSHLLIYIREALQDDGAISQESLDIFLKERKQKSDDDYDNVFAKLFLCLIDHINYLQASNQIDLHPLSQEQLLIYIKIFYDIYH